MESGKTAEPGNGPFQRRPHGKRSAQARSWKQGRRRQPSGARDDRSPHGAKPRRGFDALRARERDRPSPRWPGTPVSPAATSPWTATVRGIGTMVSAMDPRELRDDELLAQAREWRQRALRGEQEARGFAHELECEVRRRFPRNEVPQELPQMRLLGALPQTAPRRWKPW